MRRPPWRVWLPAVFAIIVLSFVLATVVSQLRLTAIDRDASDIADNAMPSIEELIAARREVTHVLTVSREQLAVARGAAGIAPAMPAAAAAPARAAAAHAPSVANHDASRTSDAAGNREHASSGLLKPVAAARHALDERINAYMLIRPFDGESQYWAEILHSESNFDDIIMRFIGELTRGDIEDAESTIDGDLVNASRELSVAIGRAIDFNAQHAHDLAEQIRAQRTKATIVAYGLDTICLVIAVLAVVMLGRAIRSYLTLAEQHRQLLEARASELEEFAGRVAHDIRNPIGTVSMALEVVSRAGPGDRGDEQRRAAVARGKRATERVVRLVEGLLGFAKAAAKPDKMARTNVLVALDDILADQSNVARAQNVELLVDTQNIPSDLDVMCEDGVLSSLLSNLTSNAIKYIGDDTKVRRVTVRARLHDERTGPIDEMRMAGAIGEARASGITLAHGVPAARVRFEVEDTGPGLPPGLEPLIFEPYVRGQKTGAGIGLGLATVRRIAEAHGGEVGVFGNKECGCTFWFELPRAAVAKLPAGLSLVRSDEHEVLRTSERVGL